MERSETIGKLAAAVVKVQAALKPVKKETENPFFHSKYADLTSIIEECRPHLVEQGIALFQLPGESKQLGTITERHEKDGTVEETMIGAIDLTTMLVHESGEFIAQTLSLPYQIKSPQSAGSALSYARRYGLQAILGIAADDDDGNAAAGTGQPKVQPGPGDLCPVHNVPWVHRVGNYKEGHAKAGQTYDFYSCPTKLADDSYCQQRPPKGYAGPQAASEQPSQEAASAADAAPAPSPAPDLSHKAQRLLAESRQLFTRTNPSGSESTATKAWRAWLAARGAGTREQLAAMSDPMLDGIRRDVIQHMPGELWVAEEGGAA